MPPMALGDASRARRAGEPGSRVTMSLSLYSRILAVAAIAAVGLTASAVRAEPAHRPRSLQMRSPRAIPARTLAQAVPPSPPVSPPSPPAGSPDERVPEAVPLPPVPPTTPESPFDPPAGEVDPSSVLSDDEFARLAAQQTEQEVILVTGSTIGRRTLTAPAPLSILDRELLGTAGRATVGDIIQLLPAQTGGVNSQFNIGNDGATRIDIRGLGANRTLTLLNGRRVVPSGSGANVSVDINTIPLAVIERVEVLKDGASAIYGSDAIGGVVNVITRSDFEGSEVTVFTGGSERGDALTYAADFVTGHNSENKRGNLVFATGLQRQEPLFAGDRGFSTFDMGYDYAGRRPVRGGATAVPNGRIDTRAIDTNGDGLPDSKELCGAGVQFCTSNGTGGYRPFNSPADLYNPQPVNYILTPSARYYLFSTGSYKLTPRTAIFFEATYANRTSAQQLAPETFVNNVPISSASMYNTLEGTVLGYQRRLAEFGERRVEQNINTSRIVGGLNGVVGDVPVLRGFKWELSYNFGSNVAETTNLGNLIKSRLANAVGPSFMNMSGVPTCGTEMQPIADCVPMNILGPAGSITKEAANYVTYTGVRSGFNRQHTVLAQSSGRLITLPNNGDLSIAAGTSFRVESGGITPDPISAIGDTTGFPQAATRGDYNVIEGFGELSLVPISGVAFADWVELNVAARAFRYDTFGSGATWKAGALYRPVTGFALRGTYSTSFRAPSVTDLYQGRAQTLFPLIDPCDTRPRGTQITLDPGVAEECRRQGVPADAAFGNPFTPVRLGGNPTLDPETGKMLTAGVVIEPPQLKGVALTIDYWRSEVDKAIQTLGTNVILASCYVRRNPASCAQIHRDAVLGGLISYIDIPIDNVGGSSSAGVDVALAVDYKAGRAGRFRHQLESQYLLRYDIDDTSRILHGLNNTDLGVRPQIKGVLTSLWQHPSGAGAGFNVRYVGAYKECDQTSCNSNMPSRPVDRWYKADLFATYAVGSTARRTSLTVGVNNLLDRDPPTIYSGPIADSDPSYDFLGRFYYARMSQAF